MKLFNLRIKPKINNSYDVIIVSHLLDENQIEESIDPYFGDMATKLGKSEALNFISFNPA